MSRARRSVWPWAIALGLTTAVGINLCMVWIAVANRSPAVPGDPERDALAYDEIIARQRASTALGWRVDVGPCQLDDRGACEITLEVVDRAGKGIDGLRGHIVARRSDSAELDRDASLRALGVGRYAGTLAPSATGLYALAVELDGEAEQWFGTHELWIPKSGAP